MGMHSSSRIRRRTVGVLLAVVLSGTACERSAAAPNPQAQVESARSSPLMLEFDLPEEFFSRRADAADAVTGFRVGYFRTTDVDTADPVHTIDFAREAIAVQGRSARVPLPRDGAPQGLDMTLRIQTLSRTEPSAWSGAIPLAPPSRRAAQAGARSAGAAAAGGRAEPSARRRQDELTPPDLEGHAALEGALRARLAPGADLEAVLGRFRRLEDLALAVVISRDHDVPFDALSQTHAGPPRVSIRNAVAALRTDEDARRVVRASRDAASQLVEKK